jgi:cell division protein FtsI (penicillin-binding protein 3)
LVAIAIAVKLTNIQWVEGDYYRKLAKERTVKNFVILQMGNIYSSDGSLLATSIPNYEIRFDAVTKLETFEKNVQALSDSLSVVLDKSSSFYQHELRRAKGN